MSTFWDKNGIIQPTPGSSEETPYHYLVGSDVGLESPEIDEGKEALYPSLNGVAGQNNEPGGTLPPLPASFDSPTADDFLSWHSAHQLQYIVENGEDDVVTIDNEGMLTAVRSADGFEVFIVENLTKQDIATMSPDDQQRIAATAAFGTVASRLGFRPGAGEAVDDARRELKDTVSDAINLMNASKENMSADDVEVFTDQLNNLNTRLDGMAVFHESAIGEQINEIKERYDRAEAFKNFPREAETEGRRRNVHSLDNEATIDRGYNIFIEQEKRLRDLDNQAMALSSTGSISDKALDVPTLIFLFSLYANLRREAEVAVETEEIQQQNKFLRDYSAMQAIVNRTLKTFSGDNAATDRKRVLGEGAEVEINDPDLSAILMFEEGQFSPNYRHPLEKLRDLPPRPFLDMVNFEGGEDGEGGEGGVWVTGPAYLKSQWDAFATELSDAVSLINQQTQIKMNEINTLEKEKNRFFEMANNAVRKMTDMIQQIART